MQTKSARRTSRLLDALPRYLVRALGAVFIVLLLWFAVRTAFVELGAVSYDTDAAPGRSQPTTRPPNQADLDVQHGYDWARQNGVLSHQQCKSSLNALASSGCSRFVTEQKHIPPTPTGKEAFTSTSDCVAFQYAYYRPLFDDMLEKGESHAVSSWTRRRMLPDLKSCENIDNVRIGSVIWEPTERLTTILARLKTGGSITAEDIETVRRDYPPATKFREDPQRTQFLALAEQLFALTGGKQRYFPQTPPPDADLRKICQGLAGQIAQQKEAYRTASEHLQSAQQVSTVQASAQEIDALRQIQFKSLEELERATTNSKETGCDMSMTSLVHR